MLRLEDIKSGALIQGLEPDEVVRIVTIEPIGIDALAVYYKKSDGSLYVRKPFTKEPDWAVTSINLDISSLITNTAEKTI